MDSAEIVKKQKIGTTDDRKNEEAMDDVNEDDWCSAEMNFPGSEEMELGISHILEKVERFNLQGDKVYGCSKDLSSSKDYHKRHKVCDGHSKTAKVIVNGLEQRFCQQCSRFHLLGEFDDGK